MLLGVLAGGPGLIAASAVTPSIARLVQVPPSFDVSVDQSAVGFVALVAALAGIVSGLAPARHAWRHDLLTPLRGDQLVDPGRLRRGRLRSLLPFIREAIEALDPTVGVMGTVVTDDWQRAMEGPRIRAALAIFVGATALALAVIGLFGITAFVVEQRVHEIGVRRAIGATSVQLVVMLLRDNLRPVVIGVACGLLLSFLAAQALSRALFGISRHDPLALAAAVLVLIAASTLAVLVPARRAASVNPAHLLKLG